MSARPWSRVAGVLALALVGGALMSPASADAQAWIRSPGHVYGKLAYRLIRADSIYAPNGNVIGAAPYRQHAIGFYAEAGIIARWLMISLDGDLYRRALIEDLGGTQGLGDMRLGLYTGLLEVPFRLAFGVQFGLPTGDPSPSSGIDAISDGNARTLPTGDGEFDVALRLYAGHGFSGSERWPFNHYVLAELGVWLRTEGFTHQIVYRGEIGATPKRSGWDRLSFALRVTGVQTVRNGAPSGNAAGLGDGLRFMSPGVELSLRLVDQLRLGFSVEGAVYAANLPAGANWQVYMSWER